MSSRVAQRAIGSTLSLGLISACHTWQPPLPTFDEAQRGLIVMYPGSFNSTGEMIGFFYGLKDAGVDQAIEIVPWSLPLEHFFYPDGFVDKHRPWAREEAARLIAYMDAHPDVPVTLFGFSAGAMTAIMVTEELPADRKFDCVIMMSPGVSRGYDLGPMLNKTDRGAVVYWSPLERFTVTLTTILSTVDGTRGDPAATFGFDIEYDKLTQIMWGPELNKYGNHGEHLDYFLLTDWIAEFVAPWVRHD